MRLFTGRTHQIRVHLAHEGHPLLGDAVYGSKQSAASRQMLHAWKLEFAHPVTGAPLSFSCPPPEDFAAAMLAEERGPFRAILTGMPGCGKSTALACLKGLGAAVWSADAEVAAQYRPGADGWHLLRRQWGSLFMREDGEIDRAALSRLLADRPGMRQELEGLIHPLVQDSMLRFLGESGGEGIPLLAAEVPLWFESGWPLPQGASVTVISCADEIRFARLASTRGWSRGKIAAVESWQWPQERKKAAADFLLPNEGTPEELERNAEAWLARLRERRAQEEEEKLARWRKMWGE